MTDKEIIQALTCCIKDDYDKGCMECPAHCYKGCDFHLAKFALDLINRQQRRIKRLETEINWISKHINDEYKIKAVQNYFVQRKALEDILNELEKDLEKESEE